MPRTFKQVLAEVNAKSNPQRQLVLKQVADIPRQQLAEESALAAKKDQAYDDIVSGARQRGLGFAGIPLGEQAKYAATEYAPAVANMKSAFQGRKLSLESALADIGKQNYTDAYNIYNTDRAFAEQQRQFNQQMKFNREQAARSAASGGGGGGGGIADYLGAVMGGQTQNVARQQQSRAAQKEQADYNFVKNLINQVNGGNGTVAAQIIKQARDGNQRSAAIMKAFYQLQKKPIPQGFRSFIK